jgi:hypothetical protein
VSQVSRDREQCLAEPGESMAEMLTRLKVPASAVVPLALARMAAAGVKMSQDDRFKVASIVADMVDTNATVPETWEIEYREQRRREYNVVYFIRHGQHIKIGVTTQTAERRIAGMQLPPGAHLVAKIPGADGETEKQLHRRFAASRVKGEWFTSTPELEALISTFAV